MLQGQVALLVPVDQQEQDHRDQVGLQVQLGLSHFNLQKTLRYISMLP